MADQVTKRDSEYLLRLYVAGDSRRCMRARKNLERICKDHFGDSYHLEVIDIGQDPGAAEEADILAVPTLVKAHPLPVRKVVGDLSRTDRVLEGLGIHPG